MAKKKASKKMSDAAAKTVRLIGKGRIKADQVMGRQDRKGKKAR